MTVSAVARLIPKPPALVDSRKANCGASGAMQTKGASCKNLLVQGDKSDFAVV